MCSCVRALATRSSEILDLYFSGFKNVARFAAILGKTLAQLAIDGRSDVDVTHFSVDRRAITDASYPFWRDARPATAGAKL
jgi:hypothetical protein